RLLVFPVLTSQLTDASFRLFPLGCLPALPSLPTRRSSDLECVISADSEVAIIARKEVALIARGCTIRNAGGAGVLVYESGRAELDRKSTRLNSSHVKSSYAVFCLKKKRGIGEVEGKGEEGD